ncbi:MAG: MscL family protein [Mycoplasmatales bacterium]
MKKFLLKFKDFLDQTTFVEVAVGLLIASAVKDLITSFTESLITPIISKIFTVFGLSQDPKAVTTVFGIDFSFYTFISDLISFIIILFVAFLILESYAKFKEFTKKEKAEEEVITKEQELLSEIRDLLKNK